MRPLIDRVSSTWAKVGVTLLGTLAVIAWLVLVPSPADAAVGQPVSAGCDHVRVAQYGPAEPCEPSPQTGEAMLVGVECAGAAGIGAVFGGWQGGAAGGLGCAWTHLW